MKVGQFALKNVTQAASLCDSKREPTFHQAAMAGITPRLLSAMSRSNLRYAVSLLILVTAVSAKEIVPTKDQIMQHRGTTVIKDGVRTQTGELDETGHGPITLYTIPMGKGTISYSWKIDKEQKTMIVVDGKRNGKATHLLKVYFNGRPGKKSIKNQLTIMTYDGSTKQKKKAKFHYFDYHSTPGDWHHTSVTIEGNQVVVKHDDKTFTATSEKLREPIERFGIGNYTDSLHTKDLKILSSQ